MRFITEMDLRKLYKKNEFTMYSPQADTRLTPGARQFLIDRRISFEACRAGKKKGSASDRRCTADTAEKATEINPPTDWLLLKLLRYMEHTESLVLLAASQFYGNTEFTFSEELVALSKWIHQACKSCQQKKSAPNVTCWGCTAAELHARAAGTACEWCWESMPKDEKERKNILWLYHVQTAIRNAEPLLLEVKYHEHSVKTWCDEVSELFQSLDDILCIMMEKCLRGLI